MKKLLLASICLVLAGCGPEITTTPQFKKGVFKSVYVKDINSTNPPGSVMLHNSIAQEFVLEGFTVCNTEDAAEIVINGNAYVVNLERGYWVESVSVIVLSKRNEPLLFLNYKGTIEQSFLDVGKIVGKSIAEKLK